MRVEFVTDTFAPDVNGVAMTLGRLVDGLRKRGHLVHVLHTADRGKLKGETNLPSVPLPGYKEVRLGLPGRLKLFRRWERKTPDVVYVATESPLGYSAIKAASSLQIPVVAGFHTNFDSYLEQYRLRGLKPVAQAYLKKVHNRADLTVAPSRDVVERLHREGVENVELLGRGVDIDLFAPSRRSAGLRAEWGARAGSSVAMIVGRVAAEKNLEVGIRAFEQMRTVVPDTRCVIVGDGPIRPKLEKDHSFVHFAGMRTGEDLAQHYASADVLLFPSETETFGNVLLEGMASGLVTVSYDYAAAARHVEHGRQGWKVPLGEEDEFVAHAVKALDLPAGIEMRQEARKAVESHGWDRVIDSFEERLVELTACRVSPRRVSRKKAKKQPFETVFVSDLHLGTKDAKAKEIVHFLKNIRCKRLILNGDIVDGWALKRGGVWRKSHTRFVRTVLRMMEKNGVEVIYLRGNHDEVLDNFVPLELGGVKFAKEYIHEAKNGKRYLVVHGDGFDRITTHYRWLSLAGSVGYDLLLAINRIYNRYRRWRGKDYFSMSKAIKAKVKAAVSWVDNYAEQLRDYARRRKCDGIICGHIHTPADEQVEGVHYLNSGDWVETLSAVVEHEDGRFEVLYYEDFLKRAYERKNEAEERDRGKQEVVRGTKELPGKVPV